MERRPDTMLDQRNIVIRMLIVGIMNKQSARHYQAYECSISKIRRMGSIKNLHPTNTPYKTTSREDIDNATSFRRNRFLSNARIPGLVRNATGTRICAKSVQRRLLVRACADVARTLVFRLLFYITCKTGLNRNTLYM